MQQDQLPGIRNDHLEWKVLDSQITRGVLRRCERAFKGFFTVPGVCFPRFKPISKYRTIELAEVTPAMVKHDGKNWWLR